MSSKSVPCLADTRFMMACSFMAIRGPGSATSVLTSTCAPLDDSTSMVTSLAVSLAQAWAEAWRRSPGSSLGWSISNQRLSDQGADFGDALDDGGHRVTDERHAATRHVPTSPVASRH